MDAARVDVGSRQDENGDDFYVFARGCVVEHGNPLGACGVRVGARFDQGMNGREDLRNGRAIERRSAFPVPGIGISSHLGKRPDSGGIACPGGVMQQSTLQFVLILRHRTMARYRDRAFPSLRVLTAICPAMNSPGLPRNMPFSTASAISSGTGASALLGVMFRMAVEISSARTSSELQP